MFHPIIGCCLTKQHIEFPEPRQQRMSAELALSQGQYVTNGTLGNGRLWSFVQEGRQHNLVDVLGSVAKQFCFIHDKAAP